MHGSRCRMKIKKVRKACSSKILQREVVGKIRGSNSTRTKMPKTKNLVRAANRPKMISTRILVVMRNLSSKRRLKTATINIRIQVIRHQESRTRLDKIRIHRARKAYSKHIPSNITVASRVNPRTNIMITCYSIQLAMMTQVINVSKQIKNHMKKNKKESNWVTKATHQAMKNNPRKLYCHNRTSTSLIMTFHLSMVIKDKDSSNSNTIVVKIITDRQEMMEWVTCNSINSRMSIRCMINPTLETRMVARALTDKSPTTSIIYNREVITIRVVGEIEACTTTLVTAIRTDITILTILSIRILVVIVVIVVRHVGVVWESNTITILTTTMISMATTCTTASTQATKINTIGTISTTEVVMMVAVKCIIEDLKVDTINK